MQGLGVFLLRSLHGEAKAEAGHIPDDCMTHQEFMHVLPSWLQVTVDGPAAGVIA